MFDALGGDALNGYSGNGEFFVGHRGDYTRVSRGWYMCSAAVGYGNVVAQSRLFGFVVARALGDRFRGYRAEEDGNQD